MQELESYPETKEAVIIALNTGLRKMGILGCRVSDLNLKARTLRYIAKGGKRYTIPLNSEALAAFERLAENPTPDGFLFHIRTGNNLSTRGSAFRKAVERAKIEDFHFHDLRHTFATRLIGQGVHPLVIKELMGHANLQMTEIYAQAQWSEMVEAVSSGRKVLQFETKAS